MVKTFHSILLSLSLLSSHLCFAQEVQSGTSNESSDQTSSETTENLNSNRGGFLGFGGQKPLQKVGGIPLPSRQNRPSVNATSTQFPNSVNPTLRRSKPTIGELTTDFPARFIYLNGKNISTVREQRLEGVSVLIDGYGNVHISAPHYEVQETTHYRPLLPREIPKVAKPSPSPAPAAIPPVESDNTDEETTANEPTNTDRQGTPAQKTAGENAANSSNKAATPSR